MAIRRQFSSKLQRQSRAECQLLVRDLGSNEHLPRWLRQYVHRRSDVLRNHGTDVHPAATSHAIRRPAWHRGRSPISIVSRCRLGSNGPRDLPYIKLGAFWGSDLAIAKTFRIGEKQNLLIRASANNWLNHPLLSFSGTNQFQLNYLVNFLTGEVTAAPLLFANDELGIFQHQGGIAEPENFAVGGEVLVLGGRRGEGAHHPQLSRRRASSGGSEIRLFAAVPAAARQRKASGTGTRGVAETPPWFFVAEKQPLAILALDSNEFGASTPRSFSMHSLSACHPLRDTNAGRPRFSIAFVGRIGVRR